MPSTPKSPASGSLVSQMSSAVRRSLAAASRHRRSSGTRRPRLRRWRPGVRPRLQMLLGAAFEWRAPQSREAVGARLRACSTASRHGRVPGRGPEARRALKVEVWSGCVEQIFVAELVVVPSAPLTSTDWCARSTSRTAVDVTDSEPLIDGCQRKVDFVFRHSFRSRPK